MPSNSGNLEFGLTLGFIAGLISFFKGFRVYRKYRVLSDTPEIPIRSIPMGVVHIHGRAAGDERVTSPVTHRACYFFTVDIEKWEVKNNSGHWQHCAADSDGVKFYLDDGSGKVLVDARAAEFDLTENGKCELDGSRMRWQLGEPEAGWAPTESELRQYVTQANVHKVGHLIQRGVSLATSIPSNNPATERKREAAHEIFSHPIGSSEFGQAIREQALLKMQDPSHHSGNPEAEQRREAALEMFSHPFGSPEFLAGMMKQPLLRSKPLSNPQEEQARRAAIEAFNHPVNSPEFKAGIERLMALAPEAEKHKGDMQKFFAMLQSGQSPLAQMGRSMEGASGKYRFTERCILPDHWYDVTGTCSENPNPKDAWDRNLIVKGEHESTFLISYRAEKEVEANLRKRAAYLIVGGAGAAVACLALLLLKLGLF